MAAKDVSAPVIITENLTKIYRHRHLALNNVSLEVEQGTVLGVLGPNGAGKTTLVKLLVGLQVPTTGRLSLFGGRRGLPSGMTRQRIGYVPADLKFPDRMTSIDYLDFVGRLCGMMRTARRARLAYLLRAADLVADSSQSIRFLSTGMRTRLAIAASLMHDPELLIWDEPARGLDAEARRGMVELTSQLAETKTIVLCSHYLSDVQALCTHAIVLDRGEMVFTGEPGELTAGQLPSDVDIEIRGDKKDLAEAMKTIQSIEEIGQSKLNKNVLHIHINANASHATAVANVLVTLADHGVEMTDIRVTSGASDGAIANLLKEDKNRGFTRAARRAQAA